MNEYRNIAHYQGLLYLLSRCCTGLPASVKVSPIPRTYQLVLVTRYGELPSSSIHSESSIPAARIKVIGVITEARGERSTVTSAQGKISTVPL